MAGTAPKMRQYCKKIEEKKVVEFSCTFSRQNIHTSSRSGGADISTDNNSSHQFIQSLLILQCNGANLVSLPIDFNASYSSCSECITTY